MKMKKEEIISLVNKINKVKTLEGLVNFINKLGLSVQMFVNGKKELDLVSYIRKTIVGIYSNPTIEIKRKVADYTSILNGVKVHSADSFIGEDLKDKKTAYSSLIKFELSFETSIQDSKLAVEPPVEDFLDNDYDKKYDKFVKEFSNQVSINIMDIEIFE